jgi:hypothetical protein
VPHPALRHGGLDRLHIVIEPDSEVGIVPADDGILDLGQQKLEVIPQPVEAERLIIDCRVDAEAAGVGASQAPDHRHHLDGRRFLQGGFHEPPPLLQHRQLQRLPGRRQLPPDRTMRRTLPADFGDGIPIGEAEHVVVVFAGILRVTPGMRPSQNGDRATFPKEIAQRIRQLG